MSLDIRFTAESWGSFRTADLRKAGGTSSNMLWSQEEKSCYMSWRCQTPIKYMIIMEEVEPQKCILMSKIYPILAY